MKILILNWRDIKNPSSGGAEILTHEIAKRFVKEGHAVYLVSSLFTGAKKEEDIDGVKIYRAGSESIVPFHKSVHVAVYNLYKKRFAGNVDVVIDEVHGIPFFTPFYVKEKKIVLVCEVAQDIWDHTFSFPWNIIGKIVERLYLLLYRNLPFMTISQSTKIDLETFGISSKNITVLPMGINRIIIKEQKKDKNPTMLFAGRLNKIKGIEDAIAAFAIISQKVNKAVFWIVGRGSRNYVDQLKKQVATYKLEKSVIFWDFVSEKEKFELMSRASLLIVPSMREGFGLIVPEAGSVGTPAIVYDVPGLRDIVVDGRNGIKTKKNNPDELAKEAVRILKDKQLYNRLKTQAEKSSMVYNWDKTAETVMNVLESTT